MIKPAQYYILAILLTMLTYSTVAQIQLGYRQGNSIWVTKSGHGQGSFSDSRLQKITYDREVFFRFPLRKKIFVECGSQYYSFATGKKYEYVGKESILQLNNHIQFDITNPLLGYLYPRLTNIRAFAGLNLSPRIHLTNKSQYHTLMLGLSYTHIFPVTDKICIGSQFSYQAVILDHLKVYVGEAPSLNRRISWQTSIIYRL